MTGLDLAVEVPAVAVLLRQLFVLTAVGRTVRFLRQRQPCEARRQREDRPTFFVVVPVLRESAVIADAVAHFEALADGHTAQLIVVTTARETDEDQQQHAVGTDTVALVEQLAEQGKVLHLHYPDRHGLKGDQLNYAARHCAATLLGDVPADRAFLVCYDADSRPPLDSLDRFEQTIATSGEASVFHQSARFELRTTQAGQRRGFRSWLSRGVGEGAALRANRFVSGFEIPRLLNRSTAVGRLKRRLCSGVYAHVTGHGLCVRLSLLLDLPFPTRSPLEDMQYSFYLGSRNLAMVPVANLDCAEVPRTVSGQVDQAARWFFGPSPSLPARAGHPTRLASRCDGRLRARVVAGVAGLRDRASRHRDAAGIRARPGTVDGRRRRRHLRRPTRRHGHRAGITPALAAPGGPRRVVPCRHHPVRHRRIRRHGAAMDGRFRCRQDRTPVTPPANVGSRWKARAARGKPPSAKDCSTS
jgi:hypothetical protein